MKKNKLKYIAGEYKPCFTYEHMMKKMLEEKKITKEQYANDMRNNTMGYHVIEETAELHPDILKRLEGIQGRG